MPPELHFLRPMWLFALVPLAALLVALWLRRPGDSVWGRVVDAHLLPHLLARTGSRASRLPPILLGLGWLVAVLALAGPVWERLPQPVFGTAAKRVILLDLSPSMNAADISPSRLARARFEVLDLLRATREGQVALIAFGPEPFVVSPLTGDARTIADQVPRLATDLIPAPGPRQTERALELAGALLRQAGANGGEVVLIADAVTGGVGAGEPAIAAARALAGAGIRVSVLGVGTLQGAPEPRPDGAFANDRGGAVRIARLDRTRLQDLARAGNGLYLEADPGDLDTRALIAATAGPMPAQTIAQPGLAADQWREEGPWLLLFLLPLAAIAFRRGWLIPVLALVSILPPTPGVAMDWSQGWEDLWQRPDQQAARTFAAGDGAAAAVRFEDPAWRAAARYRSGDYAGALEDLTGAAGAEADYNRGNALARLGRLDEAIAAYGRSLAQAPDHADARENLDLVRRLKEQQAQSESREQDGDRKDRGQEQSGASSQAGASQDGQNRPGTETGQGDQDSPGQQDQGGQPAGADASGSGQHPDRDRAQAQGRSGEQGQSAPDPSGAEAPAPGSDGAGGQPTGSQPDKPGFGGTAGASPPPDAGDLGQAALDGEPQASLQDQGQSADPAAASGLGLEGARSDDRSPGTVAGAADLDPQVRERQQSMEAQLRRVPDDPAGLLRQRFLLQHLRREGRLP